MDPIDLIFDFADYFVIVEQAHLVGFRLVYQQSRFLKIIDCVFGDNSFSMDHLKLQIAIFCQNQKLYSMVKGFQHLPDRAGLCKDSDLGLQLCLFILLDIDRRHFKVESSQPYFPMFSRKICHFDGNISYFSLVRLAYKTGHGVTNSRMGKQRSNVANALTQRCFIFFEISIQSGSVFSHLNEKYLIYNFSRTMRSGLAPRIVAK